LAPALSIAELALTELGALEAAGKWQVGATKWLALAPFVG